MGFFMGLHFRDLTNRSIYVAGSYDLEKLVDQKWQLAKAYREGPNFSSFSEMTPVNYPDFSISASLNKGISAPAPLLENMPGIYRAHFQMIYADTKEALPADQTYSPPFAVIE